MHMSLEHLNILKIYLTNYFAYCCFVSLILPNDVFCHKHHHPIHLHHRKRSNLQEMTTLLPTNKEHLKEALELLNMGKKTMGLRTVDPDILLQLVQNTNDDAKSSQIQQILEEPQTNEEPKAENQYLVLTGKDGKISVDNFTSVTLSPREEVAVRKGSNVQEVFKMEMEKKVPLGKENVYHKVTVIETNKHLPHASDYFSPSKLRDGVRRRRRHKARRKTHDELRGRQKRDRTGKFHFMPFSKNTIKYKVENVFKDLPDGHRSRDGFFNNDFIDLDIQTSGVVQPLEMRQNIDIPDSRSPLQKFQYVALDGPDFNLPALRGENRIDGGKGLKNFFDAFINSEEARLHRGTELDGSNYIQSLRRGFLGEGLNNAKNSPDRHLKTELSVPIEIEPETMQKRHLYNTSSVTESVEKPLTQRILPSGSDNFEGEYVKGNRNEGHLGNEKSLRRSDPLPNNMLVTSNSNPSVSTQHQDDTAEAKVLKAHKTFPSPAQYFPAELLRYKPHFQENRSGEPISAFPLSFIGPPAFANILPIRYGGHLAETTSLHLLGLTSIISLGLLCFVIGLLVYRKYDRKDLASTTDVLKVRGKNVIVKLSEDEPNPKIDTYSKPLMQAPLLSPYLKGLCYKSLALEEAESADLEWQSELGEWLSDSDVSR